MKRSAPGHDPPAGPGSGAAGSGDSIERVIEGWHASRPDLDVAPIAVIARVFRLTGQLQPRLDLVLRRHGVRTADFAVLATLVRLGNARISQARIGRELGLSAGTISCRIDRLERVGLVAREPDPEDGRGTLVAISARGRQVFEACAADHLANSQDLLAGLDESEQDQLGRLLGKLLGSLEDPAPDDVLVTRVGLTVAAAPAALQMQREVGLAARPGVLVRQVDPRGAAAAAGLRGGDLLTAADGRPLRTALDLCAALSSARGDVCTLDFVRGIVSRQLALCVRPTAGRPASVHHYGEGAATA